VHSFSIGNARPCNLQQRYFDRCPRILDSPLAQISDGRLVAEIELYSIVQGLLGNKQSLRRGVADYEEILEWRMTWNHLFGMCAVSDSVQGLAAEHCIDETYNLFDLAPSFCDLLLYRASLRLGASSPTLLAATLQTASLIMTRFLCIQEPAILDSPDHNFFIVAYAALTLCKFTIDDPLIAKVRSFLFHLALNDEHIAYRFACILRELQQAYLRSQAAKESNSLVQLEKDGGGNSLLYSSLMDTLPEGYDSIGELLVGFFSMDE
jgi:hypothetical protein